MILPAKEKGQYNIDNKTQQGQNKKESPAINIDVNFLDLIMDIYEKSYTVLFNSETLKSFSLCSRS